MTVTVRMDGEGMTFEREVSESTALRLMSIALEEGDSDVDEDAGSDSSVASASTEDTGLPESFFRRLSKRQKAYVRILLEEGDWVSNEEIRQRMADEFDISSGGPQAIAGIRAGFTRKYGDDFHIDERQWTGNQNQYRLNSEHIDELKENLH